MPLGKVKIAPNNGNIVKRTLLNGGPLSWAVSPDLNPLLLNGVARAWNVVCFATKHTLKFCSKHQVIMNQKKKD
jgi:hypothetical protein